MLSIDSKFVDTYVEMLRAGEIEQLFSNGEAQLFDAVKLIDMLCAVCHAGQQLESICAKISERMKQDLGRADLSVVEEIHQRASLVLETRGIPANRKYVIVKLFLNIVLVLKARQDADPSSLIVKIFNVMASDLQDKLVSKAARRNFFNCVQKFSEVDRQMSAELIFGIRQYMVTPMSEETCLDVFLEEADYLPAEVSDMLFQKAVMSFKKSTSSNNFFKRLWQDAKSIVSGEKSDAKLANLARLFTHAVSEPMINNVHFAAAVPVITQHPSLANMMLFYPMLKERGKLGREAAGRSNLILDLVARYVKALSEGQLSLTACAILTDETKVERLRTLYGTYVDTSSQRPGTENRDYFNKIVALRGEELAEYHKAADDVTRFAAKFDVEGNRGIQNVLSQFSRDPSVLLLNKVCGVRANKMENVLLKLQDVTAGDLANIRCHNRLYGSAVFRKVHETVMSARSR
jgi:hypothetical protein